MQPDDRDSPQPLNSEPASAETSSLPEQPTIDATDDRTAFPSPNAEPDLPAPLPPPEQTPPVTENPEAIHWSRRLNPSFEHGKRPLWPAIALAMLAVSAFVGWNIYRRVANSTANEEAQNGTVEARLPVRVVRVEKGLAQGWVFDEGSVLPERRHLLNFHDSGDITYIAKNDGIDLREGDPVFEGQLLARIDARRQTSDIQTSEADIQVAQTQRNQMVSQRNQMASQLNQTIAQRNQTLAQLNQATTDLRKAETNVGKAQADLELARTEFRRYQTLFEQGIVSASDRDVYLNQVYQAEAAVETARQDVRSAQEGVRSAEENVSVADETVFSAQEAVRSAQEDIIAADANVSAARARRDREAVNFEDTELVSPIDGTIAYINIREGEYWNTSYLNTNSPQDAIETAPIVVVDPTSLEVDLEIQSAEADAIETGQTAYVVLENQVSAARAAGATQQDLLDIAREYGSSATVFSVSPAQTPGSRGTKVKIRNFSQVRNLTVGGRVYVWIEVAAKPDSVVVPLGALLLRDLQSYAFVVNETDGTVRRRRVTPGIEGLSGVEILAGVEPGELLVVEGQNRLVDGAPVEIIDREGIR